MRTKTAGTPARGAVPPVAAVAPTRVVTGREGTLAVSAGRTFTGSLTWTCGS
jgi:hypothetical protein